VEVAATVGVEGIAVGTTIGTDVAGAAQAESNSRI